MADDTEPLLDDQAGRIVAFFERHALPSNLYSSAVDKAVSFAAGAAEDGFLSPVAHWQPYGARNIGGRVRALAQHPNFPLVVYAGTAAGGIFKSSDGGDTWAPIGGSQAIFAVGCLAIAPSDPSVLYIGTGEPVVQHSIVGAAVTVRNNYPSGRGFFRWQEGTALGPAEVAPLANVLVPTNGAADSYARIAVDPSNADRCWIASHTGLWRRELVGGTASFQREPIPPGMPAIGTLGSAATDVVANAGFDPAHPKRVRLFVAIGGVGIFRGVFDPNDPTLTVAWAPMLTNNLPLPCSPLPAPNGSMTWDRIRLGVCASQPDHVYAVAEQAGPNTGGAALAAYYSGDAGNTWAVRALPGPADMGGACWYSLYIEVHPLNPAIAVIGALNVIRSTNFGLNWSTILNWLNYDAGDHAQHADQHAAVFDSGDPRRLWIANDGGISMAEDVVQAQPLLERGWRKRSHGIAAAMFNDVSVHPTYPWMIGGGLQDNGTYVSFGGETWYSVFGGDGGQMSFEVANPRQFIAPFQGNGLPPPALAAPFNNWFALRRSTVSVLSAVPASGARAPVLADHDPPNDVFSTNAITVETGIVFPNHPAPFVPVIEHHPSSVGRILVGRLLGGVYLSTDFGSNYTPLVFPPTDTIGLAAASALAFGIQPGADADFWIGSSLGVVLRGVNAPPAATVWKNVNLPAPANSTVTRIAVHPADDRYVAVATANGAGTLQGRVFLSADRGTNWRDISNLTGAGATQPGSLPSGPCSSLAFDPQPAAALAQTLFVGTLVGVFVIRNLPRRSPAAGAPLLAFAPVWARFSGVASGLSDGTSAMPLIMVEDLAVVSLPARTDPGVVVNSPETLRRVRLMAATFGRGMYACDITLTRPVGVPVGGPTVRLYLRQTVVEDGLSYPRQTPLTLNLPLAANKPFQLAGDPRYPPGAMPFNDREAFDIRVDNAPFQFFDDVIDGVEFDEALSTKPVAAGQANAVYVQVHSCGWQAAPGVTVRLFFAPGAAPVANPAADPVPDLHADFWAHWSDAVLPAPAVAPVVPAAAWQRAGADVQLDSVGPNQPAVARFEWLAPATLGLGAVTHVALLAVVTADADPLVPAGQATAMKTLLRNERRVAFRLAPVTPFVPDLFIRDGLDDTGRLGGVAFGGRSPDIIVAPAALADLPGATADLANPRSADRLAAGDNFIYVRVQNRNAVDTPVDVELFWAQANPAFSAAADPAGPLTDNTHWQVVPPLVAAGNVNVTVPANGAVLVGFKFSARPAPVAGIVNALAFIALLKSHDGLDPEPLKARVTDGASMRRFFLQLADANNAALRTVRYAA